MLMTQLEEAGLKNHEAWKQARENYLFLPAEPKAEWEKLRREVAQTKHHAAMALADPSYRVPDPNE